MLQKTLIALSVVLLTAGATAAQSTADRTVTTSVAGEPKNEIRVQVNMTFFVRGAVSNSEASIKAQEDARRSLYESAARECEVLKAAIASDCRLETLNVNISRSYSSPQNEGVNANGNFGYRVTLK